MKQVSPWILVGVEPAVSAVKLPEMRKEVIGALHALSDEEYQRTGLAP
jgi:hypothetical protein